MLKNSNTNLIFIAIQNLYIAIVSYIEVLDPQGVSSGKYSRPIALTDST